MSMTIYAAMYGSQIMSHVTVTVPIEDVSPPVWLTVLKIVLWGVVGWMALALLLGLFVGRVIKNRDAQDPENNRSRPPVQRLPSELETYRLLRGAEMLHPPHRSEETGERGTEK